MFLSKWSAHTGILQDSKISLGQNYGNATRKSSLGHTCVRLGIKVS